MTFEFLLCPFKEYVKVGGCFIGQQMYNGVKNLVIET